MKGSNTDPTQWLSPLVLDQGFGVQFRDDHVHVAIGKGLKVGPEHRIAFWNVIRDACERHNTRRVLVEGSFPAGEIDTAQVIDAGEKTATVPKLWLAFHVEGFVAGEQSELFERIAASRGVRVKSFADRDKALQWLRNNTPS